MPGLRYQDLLRGVRILETNLSLGSPAPEANGIFEDSRVLSAAPPEKEVLFMALRGERSDGHCFLSDCEGRQGTTVLAEKIPRGYRGRYIRCENSRRAAAQIWYNRYFGKGRRSLPALTAVTGTNGKSSVTGMLYRIFADTGLSTGLIGTVETVIKDRHGSSAMTTPCPGILYGTLAEMADAGVGQVFLEASSHGLFYEKLSPMRIQLGIFTNLTPDHLDFHSTMKAYAEAKKKLFSLSRGGLLNADSPYAPFFRRGGEVSGCQFWECSAKGNPDCDYRALHPVFSREGVCYRMCYPKGEIEIHCPSPGIFTLANSLQAVAAAHLLGVEMGDIARTFASFHGVKGRMEPVPLEGASFTAFVDYAHTPDALEQALLSLSLQKENGRLFLIFGCGGDRDRSKRPMMGAIAAKYADYICLTEDNSRSEATEAIHEDICRGIPRERLGAVEKILCRREAVRGVLSRIREGDILLLAGKGHENYRITGEGKEQTEDDAGLLRSVYLEI